MNEQEQIAELQRTVEELQAMLRERNADNALLRSRVAVLEAEATELIDWIIDAPDKPQAIDRGDA